MAPSNHALFVAEKPSIAETLAKTLGKGTERIRAGARYVKNYDFSLVVQNNTPLGKSFSVTVSAVAGHVKELEFVDKAADSKWHAVHFSKLFEEPIETVVSKDKIDIVGNLQREAVNARMLVIWTDCDREGEAIGYEIVESCKETNPNIIVKRAVFNATNATDLWKAVNALRDLDMRQVCAVQARSEIDLRLGSVFTRFQTLKVGTPLSLLNNLLSFGPCQFPTLGFIVARYDAIKSFRPETFWYIRMSLDGAPQQQEQQQQQLLQPGIKMCTFGWARHYLFSHIPALVAYELCVSRGEAVVTSVLQTPTSKFKPIPLNTVELQRCCSRWCRLNSEITMRAAEMLYQRGFISYPRTETEVYSDTFDLRALAAELRPSTTFGGYVTRLLDGGEFEQPRRGGKNDMAHPPIHPTKCVVNVQQELADPHERTVYDFVTRHFLACISRDATGSQTVLSAKIAAETFTANGLIVHQRNFLDVYPFEKWGDRLLPNLREGDTFIPTSLELIEGHTHPPELLTESDLIGLMDRNGIGTDATVADHIKMVLDREYATKVGAGAQPKFQPTALGFSLIKAYVHLGHENAFSKPQLRAEMERDYARICRGEKTKDLVVQHTLTKYRNIFTNVNARQQAFLVRVRELLGQFEGGNHPPVQDRFQTVLRTNFSTCGVCGTRSLELRGSDAQPSPNNNNDRKAMTCSNPQCRDVGKIIGPLPHGNGIVFEPHPEGFQCPICSYQVLRVKRNDSTTSAAAPRGGGDYWFLCPLCYCHPSPQVTGIPGDVEDLHVGDHYPCFKCAKRDCALSNGLPDIPCCPCPIPTCEESLMLRRTKDGVRFYLGCKNYPSCKGSVWLPRCVKDAKVAVIGNVTQTCATCQQTTLPGKTFVKLTLTLNRASVPPHIPRELTECCMVNCRSHSGDYLQVMEMEEMTGGGGSRTAVVAAAAAALPIPPPPAPMAVGFRPVLQQPPRPTGAVAAPSWPPRAAIVPPPPRPPSFPTAPARGHASASSQNVPPPPRGNNPNTKKCSGCNAMVTLQVSHSTNNPGRPFYCCGACTKFDWADRPIPPPPPMVICSNCNGRGHTSNICPTPSYNTATAPLLSSSSQSSSAPTTTERTNEHGHKKRGHFKTTTPRTCANCATILEPRKRKCHVCGYSKPVTKKTHDVITIDDDDDDDV